MKILLLSILILLTSCMSAPNIKDHKNAACFAYYNCLYYNHKNPDKSSCSRLAETCARIILFEYCQDVDVKFLTFNECYRLID